MHAAQGVGQFADPLLVGPTDDHDPYAVLEYLFDRHDLAGLLATPGRDHIEALVQHDFGAPLQGLVVDRWRQIDPHLATIGQHVNRLILVLPDDHAVGRRRLRQLVDLIAQRRDVLACFAQGVRQLLVLGEGLGQLALRLQ